MHPTRPTPPPSAWAGEFFTVGITGTNGKTSTTHLIAAAMRASGHATVCISTVGYRVDDEVLDVGKTLEGFLHTFRTGHERGARHASVEVTSQALADGYAKRWRFDLGVFTNLSPDHLSTHGTWEHYLASKAQLFAHLGPGRIAVLNAADEHALMLDQAIPADVQRRWFHAPARGPSLRPGADLAAREVIVGPAGTTAVLEPSEAAEALGGTLAVRMVGDVFAENALAAALAALGAGIEPDAVVRGLRECAVVPGRFEVVTTDPLVIVDYAHTPDALARTCAAARRLAKGRVIVVFGAGGGATPQKREPMGEAVGRGADIVIVTNDNPRDEDPQAIAAALVRGCERGGATDLAVELDRSTAIERALHAASSGDVVVLAGKGHEQGQEIAGVTVPFCDADEVRRLVGGG